MEKMAICLSLFCRLHSQFTHRDDEYMFMFYFKNAHLSIRFFLSFFLFCVSLSGTFMCIIQWKQSKTKEINRKKSLMRQMSKINDRTVWIWKFIWFLLFFFSSSGNTVERVINRRGQFL